ALIPRRIWHSALPLHLGNPKLSRSRTSARPQPANPTSAGAASSVGRERQCARLRRSTYRSPSQFPSNLIVILVRYCPILRPSSIGGAGRPSMQRREFVTAAASAAAALTFTPAALARDPDQDRSTPVRYPDPAVEVIDPRFAKYKVGNAALERLYTGCRWAEGPVWFGDGRFLVWSDIPNNRMLRWTEETGEVSAFRSQPNYSTGNPRDREGRLVTCEHDPRRVTRTNYDGIVAVLIDRFQGKPFNAPNDLAVHSDGAVWFTD